MITKKDFSKFGIGTWGIGGFAERNKDNDDEKQIKAMSHMFKKGVNYVELNLWTGEGYSVKLAGDALKHSGVSRDKVFLSQAIYSYTSSTIKEAKKELNDCLKIFKTNWIDSLSLNEVAIEVIGEKKMIDWFHEILDKKVVRYINLNNPSLARVKQMKKEFGDKLFSVEIGFNFEIRENEDNGIVGYCDENDILGVIYQPLRRNRTVLRNWPLLIELAKKYNKSQNQIIMNWIGSRGFLPITKSDNLRHINEHLGAFSFSVDKEDLEQLNQFRPPNYKAPRVYWGTKGKGVRIDQLSNVFDEDYDKKQSNRF